MAWRRLKTIGAWVARVTLAALILFALAVGFGTTPADVDKMRAFADAVDRWQHNPDFRKVQVEYCELGSESMRTKLAFVDSTTAVMFLRSLPGLPPHLRVNDTSLAHYTNFTRGPLSAYLHLTGETAGGLHHAPGMLKYAARNPVPSDDDIRKDFLLQHKFEKYTVANDATACESVRRLINDVDVTRPFTIPADMPAKYREHAAVVASKLGYPPQVEAMTPVQQETVFGRLDEEIRESDYELWRTKQLNDCQNGIWAQVYGTMYSGVIGPILLIRDICRVTAPLVLVSWVAVALWRRKRDEDRIEHPAEGRLALEGGDDLAADR